MPLDVVLAVVVVCAGFAAQRGFRWKRQRDAFERRLEQKDLDSRRHHYRGAADLELVRHPTDVELPPAGGPGPGSDRRDSTNEQDSGCP